MKRLTEGKIVSVKMNGVVVVEILRKVPHPLYKKLVNKRKKFKASVGEVVVSLGDSVKIAQTRPQSKDTHFKVVEKVKK